jgi:hypothetical protein
MSTPDILDATCGGRTIWLPEHKQNDQTVYSDKRVREPGFHGQEGRTYAVNPNVKADTRDLPYQDESFSLIVFDPPHVTRQDGMQNLSGHVQKKYGALCAETWQHDLQESFTELFRVLEPSGTLIFKFADNSKSFSDVLDCAPKQPLFGTTTVKTSTVETRMFVFRKEESNE